MPNLKKLRAHYDKVLKDTWQEWDEALDSHNIPGEGLSPFTDLEDVAELEESPGFNWTVGWLGGVAAALDWPLDRPLGPKEWSPKGKHPRREW